MELRGVGTCQAVFGTHLEHAMAAIAQMDVQDARHSQDGFFDKSVIHPSRWARFSDSIDLVSVRDFALMWCKEFGLDPEGHPVSILEDVREDEKRVFCFEARDICPFALMIYEIHRATTPLDERTWDRIGLMKGFFFYHFIKVEDEGPAEEPEETPDVLSIFDVTRMERYEIRVMSDGTFFFSPKEPICEKMRGDFGPFPSTFFSKMFEVD